LALDSISSMAGPFHLAAIIALPLSLFWLIASSWRPRYQANNPARSFRAGLAVIIAASALVFLVIPNTVEISPGTMNMLKNQYLPARFGLSFLSLAAIAFLVVLDDAVRVLRLPRMARVACYLGLLASVIYQLGRLIYTRLSEDFLQDVVL